MGGIGAGIALTEGNPLIPVLTLFEGEDPDWFVGLNKILNLAAPTVLSVFSFFPLRGEERVENRAVGFRSTDSSLESWASSATLGPMYVDAT